MRCVDVDNLYVSKQHNRFTFSSYVDGTGADEPIARRAAEPAVRHRLPPGLGPLHLSGGLKALRRASTPMSPPYLSQLRTGQRRHPSPAAIAALAQFFGVPPAYFTDDHHYRQLATELTEHLQLRGPSPRALAEIASYVEGLERLQGLPQRRGRPTLPPRPRRRDPANRRREVASPRLAVTPSGPRSKPTIAHVRDCNRRGHPASGHTCAPYHGSWAA